MVEPPLIALAGNPNSGKTTVFNALTSMRAHVGNYPGVSVEVREGECELPSGRSVRVLDLPGVYSLTAYTDEELVARRAILTREPAVLVCVADATNLERSLYLVGQFMELGVPLVLALNMADELEPLGRRLDLEQLARLVGAPVVPLSARQGHGLGDLLEAIEGALDSPRRPKFARLGSHTEPVVCAIEGLLRSHTDLPEPRLRYFAVKLLEADCGLADEGLPVLPHDVARAITRLRDGLAEHLGDMPELLIADDRYGVASGIAHEVVQAAGASRLAWTETIDAWVTHRILGLPVLAVALWLLFELVFRVGAVPSDWARAGFEWLAGAAGAALPEGALRSLVVEGLIGGVGGVLVFVPQILLLFLGVAMLEDTGYLARAAFTLDRLMHAIGLHGKSFIPLLIGLGCGAPAILATRILSSRRDRLVTMLIVPFMSCSARLPVFVLLTSAFFAPEMGARVVLSLYVLGLAVAVGSARLLTWTLLRGSEDPFVMELPPYRMPTVRALAAHTWERAWEYVRKAGTVILAMSVVVWALCHFPQPPEGDSSSALEHSVAGMAGRAIEPAMRPLGFDWRITVALVSGVAAKEAVVSSLSTLTEDRSAGAPADPKGLVARLRDDDSFSPLIAYGLMVFVLLYVPCLVVVALVAREAGSWKWAALLVAYTSLVAWLAAYAVHTVGHVLGYQ
jgi:ferrous iron transport protein B